MELMELEQNGGPERELRSNLRGEREFGLIRKFGSLQTVSRHSDVVQFLRDRRIRLGTTVSTALNSLTTVAICGVRRDRYFPLLASFR